MRLRRRSTVRDGDIFDAMAPGVHQIMQQGVSLEQALELALPAMHKALDDVTPRVARDVVGRTPRILRHQERANRRFKRRMRKQWGQSLDRFYAIVIFAEEIGREIYGLHLKEADDEEFDPVFEALIGLYARACRVAREVHHLLSGGFPFGALARSRTLHELAVVTIVIADYGREEKHTDLANRFLQHAWIARYRDAKIYQENREALGQEPFSDEDLALMQEQHDRLIAQYGPA